MTGKTSLIQWMRSHSSVDCETLNLEATTNLGPFIDCTSNQATLYAELLRPNHQALISDSIALAWSLKSSFESTVQELSLEIMVLTLQRDIALQIDGYVHIQTNPFYVYSTEKTIENAKRYCKLCMHLDPPLSRSRLCINIPSSWEGLVACRALESLGIRTLATAVFCLEQAALAAEAGCLYVSPFVNELKVHFDPTHQDATPAFEVCKLAQDYFRYHGFETQVLAASLTSTSDCVRLAGIRHITIKESVLRLLASEEKTEEEMQQVEKMSIFRTKAGWTDFTPAVLKQRWGWVNDQEKFRLGFTRSGKGAAEFKFVQAINIFLEMQLKLEKIVESSLIKST